MDTSGFYNSEFKLRAGKFVYGPGFELHVEDKDTYTYPIANWYWFNTAEEAVSYFNIPLEEWNLDLPPETE